MMYVATHLPAVKKAYGVWEYHETRNYNMSQSKSKQTEGQKLQKKLTFECPVIAMDDPDIKEKAFAFCEDYKTFLNEGKTEREAVSYAEKLLSEAGYTLFDPQAAYQAGDKVYLVNREKSVIAVTYGKKPLSEGLRINAAHIDAPRLDLKPSPLYEKNDIAFFKTHYYGGIRKYQWATIPLSLHGVIYKKNGEKVTVRIGEDASDPVFYITDLLPHLAARQNTRKLADGIRGEELNLVTGSIPYPDDAVKNPVKLNVLSILHEKYGITEEDFHRAELEVTAAGQARDVGFDRSMIAAAGHDDRACAYPALRAEIDTKKPTFTTVTVMTDKEEIGSVGNTGLASAYLQHCLEYLAENAGISYKDMLKNALALSADVCPAYDPTFPDVFDPINSCYVGRGCVLAKYTGSRGKVLSNDASAETMSKVISIFDKNKVFWQAGELGKVDEGGGGTVAKFISDLGIDVVDIGIPVLSVHAPIELISKIDTYEAYRAFKAFYK